MSNDEKNRARLFNLGTSINKMIMDGTRDAETVADYMQRILDPSLPTVELMGRWTEKDGIIRSRVTADGWTGLEWEKFYDKNGYELSNDARKFLNSPDFKPTLAGTVMHIAVLKGELLENNLRIIKNIRGMARKMKLKSATHDLACIIRKEFTNKEIEKMGLWLIVGMSEPIDISGGGPRLLGVGRSDSKPWLDAYYGEPGYRWVHDRGFAFLSPAS